MRNRLAISVLATLLLAACGSADAVPPEAAAPAEERSDNAAADRFFELRTYTTHPGKLPDLERRFRDHTTRIFEKHGMTNIGYWRPQDPPLSENTLIYVLAYPSREARDQAWAAFRDDPEWQAVRTASEANGPIVQGVVSVFMDPSDFSKIR
jgi:hypothetical protein